MGTVLGGNWGPAFLGAFVQLIIGAFVYGKLTEKTKQNADRIEEHDKRLDGQDARLNTHGENIAELRAWRDGYNAGTRSVTPNLDR